MTKFWPLHSNLGAYVMNEQLLKKTKEKKWKVAINRLQLPRGRVHIKSLRDIDLKNALKVNFTCAQYDKGGQGFYDVNTPFTKTFDLAHDESPMNALAKFLWAIPDLLPLRICS